MEQNSPEVNFIQTQIAMMESECTQLRLSGSARPTLLEIYSKGLQHVRCHVKHYGEAGARPELLMKYFLALEQLETYLRQASER